MSNAPTAPASTPEPQGQPATPAPTPTPTPTPAPPATPAQATDWETEAKKWEKRSRENYDKAQRLDKLEEAAKTEAEKQAEEMARLREENQGYKTREQIAAWKAEVATASGIPAAALAGSTKEEIEAHAETLKPLIGQPSTPAPAVVPTVGQTPATPANVPLSEQIAAAEKVGDTALVASLKAMQLGSINA